MKNINNILSGVFLLVGSGAAIFSQQVVAAVIPVSLAVALEILNREQQLSEIKKHTEQVLVTNDSILQEKFKTQEINIAQMEKITVSKIELSEQKQQNHLDTLLQQIEQIREEVLDLSLQVQTLNLEQEQIREIVSKFRKIEDLSQHLKSNPGSARFYYERGLNYHQLNDLNPAIEDYTQAIDLNTEYAEAYHSRGILYAKLDNRKRAIEDLRQAAKFYFEQKNLEGYRQARTLYKELYDLRHSSRQNILTLDDKEPISLGRIEADQLFA